MKGGYRSPYEPGKWREREIDRDARRSHGANSTASKHDTQHTKMTAAGEIAEGGRNSGGASGEMRLTEQR